jgi:beta-phosphoglucomutase
VTRPLQGIIFDFDGVIANSEPLHYTAFRQALDEDGITLTAADYYAHYLGYDDVGVFQALGRDRGVPMGTARLDALVVRKGERLQELLDQGSVLFPGAVDFIRQAAAAVPIAIASGALRHEIDEILQAAGVDTLFRTIVASGDTAESKPSPEPYRRARPSAHRGHRRLAMGARIRSWGRVTLCRGDQQLSGERAGGRRAHRGWAWRLVTRRVGSAVRVVMEEGLGSSLRWYPRN